VMEEDAIGQPIRRVYLNVFLDNHAARDST
jgi:hypothetical protein